MPNMKRIATYAVPGLAVLALIALGALTAMPRRSGPSDPGSGKVASGPGTVARVNDGAFGELTLGGATQLESGAGAGLVSPTPSAALPRDAGGDSMKMIAIPDGDYVPTVYTYSYKGEAIDGLLSPKVDVIKPSSAQLSAPVSADILTRLGLGLADLTRLRDAKVQNFAVVEDREMGYAVHVDFQYGTLSFSQNQRWPNSYVEWDPTTGQPRNPIRQEEIPSDEEAIRVADAFLAEYGIDRSRYGAPVVRDEWRVMLAAAEDTSLVYLPESVSVSYPELVDGKPLREMNGAPSGMEVTVHARLKRVTGAWNIAARTYTASAYEGETDAARILEVASKGGPFNWTPEGDVKKVEVSLGTPTVGLVRTYQPDGEIFVSALLFPVQDPPPELAWQPYVVVPLAKELLKEPSFDGPKPMPLDVMR